VVFVAAHPVRKLGRDFVGRSLPNGTLPDNGSPPAMFLKVSLALAIATNIRFEFRLPELRIRRRSSGETTALMTVPEAAVDLYGGSVLRKDNVRPARQAPIMDPKSQAEPVESAPEIYLGSRILPPDAPHHSGAGRLVDNVDHFFSWTSRNFLVSVRIEEGSVQCPFRSRL
jgi:hypothetical protein